VEDLTVAQNRIFISYRRADAGGHAGRLYDYLKNYFGSDRLFFDVDTIQVGTNFEQKINTELDNSDAVLVLIGNQWLDIQDKNGNRRLDDPNDYVRLEVATALSRNIVVIPILLQGVQMPPENALPDVLCDLSRRNAIRINDDHWNSDCNLLAGVLKNALHVPRSLDEQKVRKYRFAIFILSTLVTLMSILYFVYIPESGILLSLLVRLLIGLFIAINIALVTHLLGNIKKELDRLSWLIISLSISGSILFAWGGPLFLGIPLTTMLVAGLLNFVEPDE
jgi:hypothetical protein